MSLNGKLNNLVKTLIRIFYTQQNGTLASCPCPPICNWDMPLLVDIQERPFYKYAALVLNRPITQSENFLNDFWNNALVRIAVDGGTRQWDLYLNKLPTDVQTNMKLPDLITGDFDSITEDILEKYKKKGCKIVHTPDQDYTDFTKALMELYKHCQLKNIEVDHVMVLGQSSGRLDQILGNIQTLFLVKERQLLGPKMKVYLVTDDAVSWILTPGQHVIKIPKDTRVHKRAWCSLVPVGEACESVTTTGLKWNLDGQSLRFGDLVSTSNTFDGSENVVVKCSHTLLWSMRIPSVSKEVLACITTYAQRHPSPSQPRP